MFGFFRKKISSNQVDLYVSDKILGVAKKVVAIVEANGVTIVDGEGVVFLAAGLFLNATYLKEHGRKSDAVRVKVIGFVKHYLDSTDDQSMLERLSDNTRWFSQGNMSGYWFLNQVIGDLCGLKVNPIHQQILSVIPSVKTYIHFIIQPDCFRSLGQNNLYQITALSSRGLFFCSEYRI